MGYTLTKHGPYGLNHAAMSVRVLLMYVTVVVPNSTCSGKVNATSSGGVEVVTIEVGAGGPNVSKVSSMRNDIRESVL